MRLLRKIKKIYLCLMIINKVKNYIKEEALFTSSDKILVALSGGADSVALLRILLQLGYNCVAAHCNFHLRGEESNHDERFVRELCSELEIPLSVIDFDTIRYAKGYHISIEMAARELRYDWFEKMRIKTGSAFVAVAHHKDDSVETFLLNLIRGAGINGLCGIHPKNGYIVRPLLSLKRTEVLTYLSDIQQDYVTDSTNLQDEYTRNKIRLNILPVMEEINPSVIDTITETSLRLTEVACIYKEKIDEGKTRVLDNKGINIKELLAETSPKSLLFEILNPLGFNSKQIEQIYVSTSGQAGKVFISDSYKVVKDRDYLLIQKTDSLSKEEKKEITIYNKGNYTIISDKELQIEKVSICGNFIIKKDKNTAFLDADKIQFPLTLRKWKAGDSFIPFGMKGRKKISDYLTDRKFSLLDKDNVYVLCSGEKIIWVVGERSDNRFRIDEKTKEVLLLRVIEKNI